MISSLWGHCPAYFNTVECSWQGYQWPSIASVQWFSSPPPSPPKEMRFFSLLRIAWSNFFSIILILRFFCTSRYVPSNSFLFIIILCFLCNFFAFRVLRIVILYSSIVISRFFHAFFYTLHLCLFSIFFNHPNFALFYTIAIVDASLPLYESVCLSVRLSIDPFVLNEEKR